MADILESIMSINVMGIPIVPIIGIILIAYLVYLATRPRAEKFKRKDGIKEIKKTNDEEFKDLSIYADQELVYGFNNIRHVIGVKRYQALPVIFKDKKGRPVIQPRITKEGMPETLTGLKTRQNGLIGKLKAFLGFGIKYYIVDDKYLKRDGNKYLLHPSIIGQDFMGVVVVSESGREIVENINFKKNRENELDSFQNWIPKMDYLNTQTSSTASKLREIAKIEKEKYQGQIEGAENA